MNDLTQGSVWKKLLAFFFPIAIETWFQQFYNTVDALIVSKYVGTQALAAVGGSATMIIHVIVNLFVALTSGAAVIIAQFYGAREKREVGKAVSAAVLFCTVVGLILSFFFVLFAPQILNIMGTPKETVPEALSYMRICFAAAAVVLVMNMESGILRACGNSKVPLLYMVISCITNIVLDYSFVRFFHWGVTGVAAATVAAQILNLVLLTIRLLRTNEPYRLRFTGFRFRENHLGAMLRIGIPSALQACMYGVANTVVQVAVNSLGTVIVASWSMYQKIDGFYWATCTAVGAAVTNFVGQNYGAKREDRIRECTKVSFLMFLGFTIVFSLFFLFVVRPLLPLVINDPKVIQVTGEILICFVPYFFLWTIIEILTAVMRGKGNAVVPVIILAIGICLFRILWVFTVFAKYRSLYCISICYPCSWLLTDLILIGYTLIAQKRKTDAALS